MRATIWPLSHECSMKRASGKGKGHCVAGHARRAGGSRTPVGRGEQCQRDCRPHSVVALHGSGAHDNTRCSYVAAVHWAASTRHALRGNRLRNFH